MVWSITTKTVNQEDAFRTIQLDSGVVFRYLPVSKWKTLSISIFCKLPAVEQKITSLALVPRLATKGMVNLPSMRDISRFLENMYGAGMKADAMKIGPIQVIRFGIDIPAPSYLEGSSPVDSILSQALSFVWDLATRPNLEGDGYPRKVFDVERDEQRRAIMGIINNRPYYATVRLMEKISNGDPRGLPAWGSLADLETVDRRGTWDIWRDAFSHCPISIYAVGKDAERLVELFPKRGWWVDFGRTGRPWDISAEMGAPLLPKDVLRIEEMLPGHQSILCMAFSTGIRVGDPDLPAMLFCDGLLGGFPHSKLFTVVREQHSLAYFADTLPNTWRGMILALAGIADSDRVKVENLIRAQVEAVSKGEISDEEMESTRMGLVRRLVTESDSQGALIGRALHQEILGGAATQKELVNAILNLTKEDVSNVASKMDLKAVYTLRAKGGDVFE